MHSTRKGTAVKYDTYKTNEGDAEVQAYKAEESHQVQTIGGPRTVAPGEYVVQRDRPELHDVFPGDVFEAEHSKSDEGGPAVESWADIQAEDEKQDEELFGYDPTQHTVAEVQDYIRQHPDERDAVLARERAGANRSTVTG